VAGRRQPAVSGQDGLKALEVALEVLARIEAHAAVVEASLSARGVA